MQLVKKGDLVSVDYVGLINDDEIFDTTVDSGPLEFEVGLGTVLPAFDQAVLGMSLKEQKKTTIQPREAYGESIDELFHTIDQNTFGKDAELTPGMLLNMDFEHEGETRKVPAVVTKVENGLVTVNFNHPLAGKTLNYTISIIAIKNKG